MPVSGPGPYQLRALSRRLREAGEEGKGLRRELFKAATEAVKPLAAEIKDPAHLRGYMPNRYASVLAADLSVTSSKSTGRNPGVSVKAKGRAHKRKVARLDGGVLAHPVYGNRDAWVDQRARVRAGFFEDACKDAAPRMRAQVLDAMHTIGRKITGS